MSVRRTALLALLALLAILAVALGSGTTAGAAVDTPTPLAPDQADSLASAPADVPSGSSTQVVDVSAVLAAAALPGAQTTIESDIAPQNAIDPLSDLTVLSTAGWTCWANYVWHQWGTWPYQQRITDTTYWCAVYNNHITFRTSTTTASGTLCGVDWRAGQLIDGGVGRGFTYFTNRSSAGFSCQTVVPWITIHKTHYEDIKRNDRGGWSLVRTG